MRILAVTCLAVILLQNDCQSAQKSSAPKAGHTASHPTHRFTLADPVKDVAFDTQTGQLCRTWDWTPAKPDERDAGREVKLGQFTPTCVSLYEKYPTQGDSQDPLRIRE